jgi:hypothetical protein
MMDARMEPISQFPKRLLDYALGTGLAIHSLEQQGGWHGYVCCDTHDLWPIAGGF